MSNHAGFASLVVMEEPLLNDIIAAYHTAGVLPVNFKESGTFTLSHPDVGGGVPVDILYDFDLFFDVPVLSFDQIGAPPRLPVYLRFGGPVSLECPAIPLPGFNFVESTLEFKTKIEILPPNAILTDNGLQAGLDFSDAEVKSLDVWVREGPDLPAFAKEILTPYIADRFTQWLRDIGPQHAVITPEVVNQIGALPFALDQVTIKLISGNVYYGGVGCGGLGIGVDIAGLTSGSINSIENFTEDSNMAACTHPDVIMALLDEMRPQIVGFYGSYSVDSAHIELGSDHIHVWGEATEHVNVQTYAVPILTVGYSVRARPVLTGDKITVDVFDSDIELPWWAVFLGLAVTVFTLGGGTFIAAIVYVVLAAVLTAVLTYVEELIEDMVEDNVEGMLRATRTHYFDIPETVNTKCMLHVDELQLGSEGLLMRNTFTVGGGREEVQIEAPQSIFAWADISKIHCSARVPDGLFHPLNPNVKVSWTADKYYTSSGPGQLILRTTRPVTEPGALVIDFEHDVNVHHYDVSLHIFHHRADGTTVDHGFRRETIWNVDRLDKSHPFVRWSRKMVYFVSRGGVDKWGAQRRDSAIHRTDLPGRCRYAAAYSSHATLEYLDELPFPIEEIEDHRDELCEYCFYGGCGPGKTELIIDLS